MKEPKILEIMIQLERYEAQGVGKKDEVIAYCHVGLRASMIYTVAKTSL